MKSGRASGDAFEPGPSKRQRLDKYLWFARVVKTRTLATKLVAAGQVRINSERTVNPAKQVGESDVLTIALDRTVRVLRITGIGERRGPYEEARLLFDELTEPALPGAPSGQNDSLAGTPEPDRIRPDKRDRRLAAALKRGE